MSRTSNSAQSLSGARRGFSLIELLTVILIIAVLIGILIPAIAGVRRSARRTVTQALLREVSQGAAAFRLSENRAPGYFSQTEMGRQEQAQFGFTAMENMMLDLAFGPEAIRTEQPTGAEANAFVEVGPYQPMSNQNVWVNPGLLGATESAYLNPAGDYITPLGFTSGTESSQFGAPTLGHIEDYANPAAGSLPDLVDPFGTPILAWVADETAPEPTVIEEFARIDSGANGETPALFYWNSNAGYLAANRAGRVEAAVNTDQPANNPDSSLIGIGALQQLGNNDQRAMGAVLSAILANPAALNRPIDFSNAANEYGLADDVTNGGLLPLRPRADVILHSAGPDFAYLSNNDSKEIASGPLTRVNGLPQFNWKLNLFNASGEAQVGDDGRPTTVNVADFFDDIIVAN